MIVGPHRVEGVDLDFRTGIRENLGKISLEVCSIDLAPAAIMNRKLR